jgi:hypothetical protein
MKNDKLPPSHSQLDDIAIKFVLKKKSSDYEENSYQKVVMDWVQSTVIR